MLNYYQVHTEENMSFFECEFIYMMVMEEASHRIKIGYSNNPVRRCKELYSSGVPHPYHILHCWQVRDMVATEKLIHKELAAYRPNPSREFFEVFEKFPDSVDYTLPVVINGFIIHNELSLYIDNFLTKSGIEYNRWWLNDLESYDYTLRQNKRKIQ